MDFEMMKKTTIKVPRSEAFKIAGTYANLSQFNGEEDHERRSLSLLCLHNIQPAINILDSHFTSRDSIVKQSRIIIYTNASST
jgi:hypothetical protein